MDDWTIMVVDVVGFAVINQLNNLPPVNWSEVVHSSIISHGGKIAGIYGDSTIAAFSSDKCAISAIDAAREIESFMQHRRDEAKRLGIHADIRPKIGIAMGRAFVGNLRPADMPISAVIGPAKDLAIKLHEQCRTNKVDLLICEQTARLAATRYEPRLVASTPHHTAYEPILRQS